MIQGELYNATSSLCHVFVVTNAICHQGNSKLGLEKTLNDQKWRAQVLAEVGIAFTIRSVFSGDVEEQQRFMAPERIAGSRELVYGRFSIRHFP